jgi:hypothetical protein
MFEEASVTGASGPSVGSPSARTIGIAVKQLARRMTTPIVTRRIGSFTLIIEVDRQDRIGDYRE